MIDFCPRVKPPHFTALIGPCQTHGFWPFEGIIARSVMFVFPHTERFQGAIFTPEVRANPIPIPSDAELTLYCIEPCPVPPLQTFPSITPSSSIPSIPSSLCSLSRSLFHPRPPRPPPHPPLVPRPDSHRRCRPWPAAAAGAAGLRGRRPGPSLLAGQL